MNPSLLLVDDDPNLLRALGRILSKAGFEVTTADGGEKALQQARRTRFDAAILDWALPDRTGLEVLRELRAMHFDGPAIMLTGERDTCDKVAAFEAGATDYVVKPGEPKELIARIRAHLRHHSAAQAQRCVGKITIHAANADALVDGKSVGLTATELQVLSLLARCAGRAVSRAELVEQIWEGAPPSDPAGTLEVHIVNLRRKLGSAADQLETVRGLGFRLRG